MKSIQNKFLSVVISGIIVMALAISAVSMYTINSILHSDADMLLDTLCRKEAALIDDTLGGVEQSVHIMERYIKQELPEAVLIGNSVFRHNFTEDMKKMYSNIAAGTDGAVSFYLHYNPNLAPAYSGFFFSIDSEGGLTARSPHNPAEQDSYRLPAEAENAIWLEPYFSITGEGTVVSYAAPVYVKGQLIGVVGMDLDFSVLTETVNNISVYDDGCAHLLSGSGTQVYNKPMLADNHPAEHKGSFAESSSLLLNGMMLKITAGYTDIQKNSAKLLYGIASISLFVLAASVLFTILTTRRIVAPLRKLTAAAKQLADGKTDIRVECDSEDEIGTLAGVFNSTVDQLEEYMGYINTLAYRDSLTGVRNRTAYMDMVAQLDRRIEQGLSGFALVVADINGLKKANDTFGHDAGSELIVQCTSIICGIFKRSPVFRIGGDEFVVILERDDFVNRIQLLEEMDRTCARSSVSVENGSIPVSIARGLAVYDPENDSCTEDVFNRADKEMYIHKQQCKAAAAQGAKN